MVRAASLQTQVQELELELERVSRALESQKTATSELEKQTSKKTEEMAKDLKHKVYHSRRDCVLLTVLPRSKRRPNYIRSSDSTQITTKLRGSWKS